MRSSRNGRWGLGGQVEKDAKGIEKEQPVKSRRNQEMSHKDPRGKESRQQRWMLLRTVGKMGQRGDSGLGSPKSAMTFPKVRPEYSTGGRCMVMEAIQQ